MSLPTESTERNPSPLDAVRAHLSAAASVLASERVAAEIAVAGATDDATRDVLRGRLRAIERATALLQQTREAVGHG